MADYRNPGGAIPKAAGIEPGPRSAGAGGRDPKTPSASRSGMKEKPGFPGADLPGKAGPDRSAGIARARQHPYSRGL